MILEPLEKRELLATVWLSEGVLHYSGDATTDYLIVSDTPDGLVVENLAGPLVAQAGIEPLTRTRVRVASDRVQSLSIDLGEGRNLAELSRVHRWPARIQDGDGDGVVIGGQGADWIEMGEGDDWVDGQAGDDQIMGGGGSDRLVGGDGLNHVFGGQGDDWLAGGPEPDVLIGDAGADQFDAADVGDVATWDGADLVRDGLGELISRIVAQRAADRPPTMTTALSDVEMAEDSASRVFDLAGHFAATPGSDLRFRATSSASSVAKVAVYGSTLTVTPMPDATGLAWVQVVAEASNGLDAHATFQVAITAIDDPPRVATAPGDIAVAVGAGPLWLDMTTWFSDPDSAPLSFSAASSDVGVASVEVDGSMLRMTFPAPHSDSAVVTVTASDGTNSTIVDLIVAIGAVTRLEATQSYVIADSLGRVDIDLAELFSDDTASGLSPRSYSVRRVDGGGPGFVVRDQLLTLNYDANESDADDGTYRISANYDDGTQVVGQWRFQRLKGGVSIDEHAEGAEGGLDEVGMGQAISSILSLVGAFGGLFNPDASRDINSPQVREGTPENDSIVTGRKHDVVSALAGDDWVVTLGGPDDVSLGKGDDFANTGGGNDTVQPGEGADTVYTGGGRDTVNASPGNDVFYLGTGVDTIVWPPGSGHDVVVDPSRAGIIDGSMTPAAAYSYHRTGEDMELVNTATGDTLLLRGFYATEPCDWTLESASGVIDLAELPELQGLPVSDQIRLSKAIYDKNRTASTSFPGFHQLAHYGNANSQGSSTAGLYAELHLKDSTNAPGESVGVLLIRGTENWQDRFDWLSQGRRQAEHLYAGLTNDVLHDILNGDRLGKARILIAGHSLGGMVGQYAAAELLRQFPNITVELNMVNTWGVAQRAFVDRGVVASVDDVIPRLTIRHFMHSSDILSRMGGSQLKQTKHIIVPNQGGSLDPIQGHNTQLEMADYVDQLGGCLPLASEAQVTSHRNKLELLHDLSAMSVKWLLEKAKTLDEIRALLPDMSEEELQHANDVAEAIGQFVETHDEAVSVQPCPDIEPLVASFDFGTDASPVGSEYDRVGPGDYYTPERGWGWSPDSRVVGQDRGAADDVNRDFVAGAEFEFLVDLPNGWYDVTVVSGDQAAIRDHMSVSLNGYRLNRFTVAPEDFARHTYRFEVLSGQLRIGLTDLGGRGEKAVLNALEIRRVAPNCIDPDGCPASDGGPTHESGGAANGDCDPAPVASESDAFRQDAQLVVITHGWAEPPIVHDLMNVLDFGRTLIKTIRDVMQIVQVSSPVEWPQAVKHVKGVLDGISHLRQSIIHWNDSRVPEWTGMLVQEYAQNVRRLGFDAPNTAYVPVTMADVDLEEDYPALLAPWNGSHDFLVADWTATSSAGTLPNFLDMDEARHRQAVIETARRIKRLIEARVQEVRQTDADVRLDVLFVGFSFGTDVHREVIDRLNESPFRDALDFVKVVSLDPVAMKRDELTGSAYASDKYHWYHPEMSVTVDAVANYYQTDGLLPGDFLERQLVTGAPLDGFDGGSRNGFLNRQGRVWDVVSGDESFRYREWDPNSQQLEAGALTDVEFSPNGRLLATAGEHGEISIRDSASGDLKHRITGHKAKVDSLTFVGDLRIPASSSGDEQYLASLSGANGVLLITRMSDGAPIWKGEHVGGTVVAASPSGEWLATGGDNGRIRLWSRPFGWRLLEGPSTTQPRDYEFVALIDGHPQRVHDLQVFDDGTIISAGDEGSVRVWAEETGGAWRKIEQLTFGGAARSLAYDAHTNTLAVATGPRVYLYDVLPNWQLRRRDELGRHIDNVHSVEFSRDGRRLASGGNDRTIYVFDTSDWSLATTFSGVMLSIRDLALTPDGARVASVGFDNPGGPVFDLDVTGAIRESLGFWQRLFAVTAEQHRQVPFWYVDSLSTGRGESFIWQSRQPIALRPDALPPKHNLALPPNKRVGQPGIDIAPIVLEVRPGDHVEFRPRWYLLRADRDDYSIVNVTSARVGLVERLGAELNVVRYSARPNQLEDDAFDITLIGPDGDTVTTTVDVRVDNYAPFVRDDEISVVHDSRREIRPLANDWDFERDAMSLASYETLPNPGDGQSEFAGIVSRVPRAPETLNYVAPSSGVGVDRIRYVVRDEYGAESDGVIYVTYNEPQGPVGVRTAQLRAHSVVAKWDRVPWNAEGYRVVLVHEGDADRVLGGISSDQGSVKVGGLNPGSTYQLRVDARRGPDDWLLGESSSPFTTLMDDAPEIISVAPDGSRRLRVEWEAVSWNPDYYLLHLKNLDRGEQLESVRVGTATAFTLTNLEPLTEYQVSVEAIRGSNRAVISPTVGVALTTPLEPPQNVWAFDVRAQDAQVRWDAPDWPIAGYQVHVDEWNNGAWRALPEKSRWIDAHAQRQLTLPDLTPDREYRLTVVAQDAPPDSEDLASSASTEFRTQSLALPLFDATASSPRSIAVDWVVTNWTPTAFRVRLVGEDAAASYEREFDGDRRHAEIGDLVAGETYRVFVAARNALTADWQEAGPITVTPDYSTPQLTIRELRVKRAELAWKAPNWQPGKYVVELRDGDAASSPLLRSVTRQPEDPQRWEIGNLVPNHTYTVRLVAQRISDGIERESSLTFTTPAYGPVDEVFPVRNGADYLMVGWTPIDYFAVTKYEVRAYDDQSREYGPVVVSPSAESHATLRGLAENSTYRIVVRVCRDAEDCYESDPVELTTERYDAPANLATDDLGFYRTDVVWSSPALWTPDRYRIELFPGSDEGTSAIATRFVLASSARRVAFDELSSGTTYTVRVTPEKPEGTDRHSTSYRFQTRQFEPPTNVHTLLVEAFGAKLEWSTPSDWTPSAYYVRVYDEETGGSLVPATVDFNSSLNRATISNLGDGCAYWMEVVVQNGRGVQFSSTPRLKVDLPVATGPNRLELSDILPTSAVASWDPPNWSPGGYKIELFQGRNSNGDPITLSDPWRRADETRQIKFSGLREQTDYFVRVTAKSEGGSHSVASGIAFTTAAFTPPANVRSGAIRPFSIQMRWDDVPWNEAEYVVQLADGTGKVLATKTLAAATTETFIDVPAPDANYAITVGARTSAATGGQLKSAAAIVVRSAVFAAPGGFVATEIRRTAVDFAWSAADGADSYRIEYRRAGSTTWQTTANIEAKSATIENLLVNTTYEFELAAIHNSFVAKTAITTLTTRNFIVATNLRATSIGDTSITLAWNHDEPFQNGFQGFVVQRRRSDDTWADITTLGTNARSYQVIGLTRKTAYTFRVRSVYASGSIASDSLTATTT